MQDARSPTTMCFPSMVWKLSLLAVVLLAAALECMGADNPSQRPLLVQKQDPQIRSQNDKQRSNQSSQSPKHRLPDLHYQFSSFATPFPQEAADFCMKYFGGSLTDPSEHLTHRGASEEATVRGVRFTYSGGAKFHDIYFILDPTKPTGPSLDVASYATNLHGTHRFDLEETWDWYMDWHYAFWVDNLDLVLYRLLRDEIPVVTRGTSFYVEIPGGMTFQFCGSQLTMLWSQSFSFCRYTDGEALFQPLQIKQAPAALPPIPELAPFHHSFFSTRPMEASKFVQTFTSGTRTDMKGIWEGSHRYSDGTCAYLEWVDFIKPPSGEGMPEFQVHFVQQFRKHQGHNMTVAGIEAYLEELHGDMSRMDAFMDYRVGFKVDDLAPFEAAMKAESVPYLSQIRGDTERSLLMQVPGGIIFELFADNGRSGADGSMRPSQEVPIQGLSGLAEISRH